MALWLIPRQKLKSLAPQVKSPLKEKVLALSALRRHQLLLFCFVFVFEQFADGNNVTKDAKSSKKTLSRKKILDTAAALLRFIFWLSDVALSRSILYLEK